MIIGRTSELLQQLTFRGLVVIQDGGKMLKVARDVIYGVDMRASTSQQRQGVDNSTFKCVLVSSTSSSS